MIRSEYHTAVSNGGTIYDTVTSWAARAPRSILLGLAVLGFGGAALVVGSGMNRFALAASLFAAGTVGAWGLIEQKAAQPHSPLVRAAEGTLVVAGSITAMLGALGFLFWVMGPAPVL